MPTITGTLGDDVLSGDQFGPAEDLILGLDGSDQLFGRERNDALFGGDEIDLLHAGNGDDRLVGGQAQDFLSGQGGRDVYDYDALSESGTSTGTRDSVIFEDGADRIDLSSIDARPSVAGNQAFTFVGTSQFTAEGQVRVFTSSITGDTIVSVNGVGSGGSDMTIELTNDPPLSALSVADFLL